MRILLAEEDDKRGSEVLQTVVERYGAFVNKKRAAAHEKRVILFPAGESDSGFITL